MSSLLDDPLIRHITQILLDVAQSEAHFARKPASNLGNLTKIFASMLIEAAHTDAQELCGIALSTGHIEDNSGIRMGGTIYINYLALDQGYHKVKLDEEGYVSDFLPGDCFNRVLYLQENHIGFTFVTLSSTEEGYNLYKRNGFEELEDDMKIAKNDGEKTCIPMYLPLDLEE